MGCLSMMVLEPIIESGFWMSDSGASKGAGLTGNWMLSDRGDSSLIGYLNKSSIQGGRTRKRTKLSLVKKKQSLILAERVGFGIL